MSRLERIVRACGGELLEGGRRALIPGPGHGPEDRSVSLLETGHGRLLVHCFSPRDDWRDVLRHLRSLGLVEAPLGRASGHATASATDPPARARDKRARARAIWAQARSLGGTNAARYLQARAIAADHAYSQSLRFHPAFSSLNDRRRRPALIAAIHDRDGSLQGVQVTLLCPSGLRKARVPTPRRVIGQMRDGAVRLMPAGPDLVVAEGVETALSAADVFARPAWAALSAHNLAAFTPPDIVERLIVAADRDEAGLDAAKMLADRLRPRLHVSIEAPGDFEDWNAWSMAQASRVTQPPRTD